MRRAEPAHPEQGSELTIIGCGPGAEDSQEELIKAVGALTKAGDVMRRNKRHLPEFGRDETEAYTTACTCGWVDLASYDDVAVMIASYTLHLTHPDYPEHGTYPEGGTMPREVMADELRAWIDAADPIQIPCEVEKCEQPAGQPCRDVHDGAVLDEPHRSRQFRATGQRATPEALRARVAEVLLAEAAQ